MIELDENVIRLISAKASKIKTYTGRQFKRSYFEIRRQGFDGTNIFEESYFVSKLYKYRTYVCIWWRYGYA